MGTTYTQIQDQHKIHDLKNEDYLFSIMMYRYLKKTFFIGLKVSFFLTNAILIFMVGLFLWLQHGPLPLDFLKPFLEKNISQSVPGFHLSVQHAEMVWAGLEHPFVISLKEVAIHRDPKGHKTFFSVPLVTLTYSLPDLVKGHLHPQEIEINKPYLVASREDLVSFFTARKPTEPYHDTDEEVDPTEEKQEDEDLWMSFIYEVFYSEHVSPTLKKLLIRHAQFTFEDDEGWGIWTFPKTDLSFTRENGKNGFNTTTVWQGQKFAFHFEVQKKTAEASFRIVAPQISTTFLKNVPSYHLNDVSPTIKKVLNVICLNPMILSVFAEGTYHMRHGIKQAQLHAKLVEADLNFPDLFPKTLPLQNGFLDVSVQHNQIILNRFSVDSRKTSVLLWGVGVWKPEKHILSVDLQSQADHIFADELDRLWPLSLAPLVRTWVLKNISQAIFDRTTCVLKGEIDFSQKKKEMTIHTLQGDMTFREGVLSYMDALPLVTNLSGKATYDAQTFWIQLTQGKSAGLDLKKGRIDIRGLNKKDQDLSMTLDIVSPVPQAVRFLDLPPLQFLHALGFDQTACTGHAETRLRLDFPLSTHLSLQDVKTQATSHLTHVSMPHFLSAKNGASLSLSEGNLNLTFKNRLLSLKGTGQLNGTMVHLSCAQNFSDQSPLVRQVHVSGNITPLWFKPLGIDVTSYVDGKALLDFFYEENRGQPNQVRIKGDLSSAQLQGLGWVKPSGSAGFFDVTLRFNPNKTTTVETFSLTGQDLYQSQSPENPREKKPSSPAASQATPSPLTIQGKASFDGVGALTSLRLDQFQIGRNDFTASIQREDPRASKKGYILSLQGNALDFQALWNQKKGHDFSFPEEPVQFKGTLKKLHMGRGETIFENISSFEIHDQKFTALDYQGYVKTEEGAKSLVSVKITSRPNQTREFLVESAAVGHLLNAFNIPAVLQGGFLTLKASKNDGLSPQGDWEGKLRVDSFSIKNLPALAQILSLASPTGLIELWSDKGLAFSKFVVRFKVDPHKITFSRGYLRGISFGMTLQGSTSLLFDRLNLYGSVIPAYMLNALLSKIPLLGEILTGGKNEGIFSVSYRVQGSADSPQVSLNPISLLTPGFLRRLFDFTDDDDLARDNEEENP